MVPVPCIVRVPILPCSGRRWTTSERAAARPVYVVQVDVAEAEEAGEDSAEDQSHRQEDRGTQRSAVAVAAAACRRVAVETVAVETDAVKADIEAEPVEAKATVVNILCAHARAEDRGEQSAQDRRQEDGGNPGRHHGHDCGRVGRAANDRREKDGE